MSADPASASPGSTVLLVGNGFSFIAPENVVSVGGAAVPASNYAIDDAGDQVLTFEVPMESPDGDQPLLLIVHGTPSNVLNFTVIQ